VLITGHRREQFDGGLEQICAAIAELAAAHPDTTFVYPVHLNPRVQEPVRCILGAVGSRNVILTKPLSYFAFVALLRRATLVLTDSGGVQEEAPTFGKPVLVMRGETDRPEGVAAGTARLVGSDRVRIVDAVSRLLADRQLYARMARAQNPYGDGRAAQRIVALCRSFLASAATTSRRRPAGPAGAPSAAIVVRNRPSTLPYAGTLRGASPRVGRLSRLAKHAGPAPRRARRERS